MTRLRFLAALALALGLGFAVALGCTRRDEQAVDPAPVVDMDLMAFLSEARALHHQANLKEEAGDLAGAAEAMNRLVVAKRPHDGKPPEVQEVLSDAYARLAGLELRRAALDRASAAVKSGLEHAPDPTYFRGHLFEVEGLVEEARAKDLADAGKTAEATRAHDKALQRLEDAVQIQADVIQRSLSARDGGPTQTTEAGR